MIDTPPLLVEVFLANLAPTQLVFRPPLGMMGPYPVANISTSSSLSFLCFGFLTSSTNGLSSSRRRFRAILDTMEASLEAAGWTFDGILGGIVGLLLRRAQRDVFISYKVAPFQ